ncbi:hypothetical protein RUM44_001425 [Polyplax serrata]|uniref:Uncharacterized protein n=1 Tax=Polyplax serrata TaxID=468196 RepID=A0ABR1ALQ4_POLSC
MSDRNRLKPREVNLPSGGHSKTKRGPNKMPEDERGIFEWFNKSKDSSKNEDEHEEKEAAAAGVSEEDGTFFFLRSRRERNFLLPSDYTAKDSNTRTHREP